MKKGVMNYKVVIHLCYACMAMTWCMKYICILVKLLVPKRSFDSRWILTIKVQAIAFVNSIFKNCRITLSGQLVVPKNGEIVGEDVKRFPNDPNNPDKYRPELSDEPGANWFNTKSMLLHFLVKGDGEFIIKTQNVILVRNQVFLGSNFQSCYNLYYCCQKKKWTDIKGNIVTRNVSEVIEINFCSLAFHTLAQNSVIQ